MMTALTIIQVGDFFFDKIKWNMEWVSEIHAPWISVKVVFMGKLEEILSSVLYCMFHKF